MIDTHAHIYLEQFQEDIQEVIKRSSENGVSRILLPNIDSSTIEDMLTLEDQYPGVCFSMIGLHPCSVKADFREELALVEQWLKKRSFLAIGEIGTDLYWDKTFWDFQKEAFNYQCELALDYQLPVVIHCRESIDETIALVAPFSKRGLTGVFHCFTGDTEQAFKITELGFYLGLGGVSTFKNGGLDLVIPKLDLSRILLETDSPYLTPAPHRGKRNEPSYTRLILERIAAILEMEPARLDKITTTNAEALFFSAQKHLP